MIERWKPVVGLEGAYEVSDLGRVQSLDRVKVYTRLDQYSGRDLTVTRHRRGRILRPGPKPSGHLSVALGRDAGSFDVHILVLTAFVGPCPEGHECCHKDDTPANNRLSNLRWGTRSDNLRDAVRNGKKPVGEQHSGAKLKASDIPLIRALATDRPKYGQEGYDREKHALVSIALRFSVSEAVIRSVRDRRSWGHVP